MISHTFSELHGAHHTCTLSKVFGPPRTSGTTWSTEGSRLPQPKHRSPLGVRAIQSRGSGIPHNHGLPHVASRALLAGTLRIAWPYSPSTAERLPALAPLGP